MKFQHLFAPRRLVQPVDILGNDRFQLPFLFPLRQLIMRLIGRSFKTNQFIPVKPVEFFRFIPIKGMAQYRFRRIIIFLVIQAVHASEIRYPALRGHPGPTEKYNIIAACYPLFQLFYLIHCPPPILPFLLYRTCRLPY